MPKHIYSSVFTVRQELSQCHDFKLQLENVLGGSLSVWGRNFPPTPTPSRLNPEFTNTFIVARQETTGVAFLKLAIERKFLSSIVNPTIPLTISCTHNSEGARAPLHWIMSRCPPMEYVSMHDQMYAQFTLKRASLGNSCFRFSTCI